jgi:transposase
MRVARDGNAWSVPSQTSGGKYRVDPVAPSRTCEDFALTAKPCKHVLAVRLVIERESGNESAVPEPMPEAVPHAKRPTYAQPNWPAYVRAQMGEKKRFLTLLAKLCGGVQEPPRAKTGRKPVSPADTPVACAYKVYSGFSARRFNCDLEDAHEAGFLSRSIHPHKISAFMENPELAPIIRQLVIDSAKPLAAVEQDFACDSSGFAGNRFVRWFDHKHGKVKRWHDWIKVQIAVGVKTDVVTAVEIAEAGGADAPFMPGLVATTAENFTVNEFSADKGYSPVENHDAVDAAGGTPFISFKSVATGWSGGRFGRMFGHFQYRRDEFLKHYHKRSNVGSTFSAIERKFGDSLRSKSRTAMINETLSKLLCFNLTVLIHEQEELGITPEFFGDDEPEEEVNVLRSPTSRIG